MRPSDNGSVILLQMAAAAAVAAVAAAAAVEPALVVPYLDSFARNQRHRRLCSAFLICEIVDLGRQIGCSLAMESVVGIALAKAVPYPEDCQSQKDRMDHHSVVCLVASRQRHDVVVLVGLEHSLLAVVAGQ